MEDSDDSSVDAADDFCMVKIPKIVLKSVKDAIKDSNKHATDVDEKSMYPKSIMVRASTRSKVLKATRPLY